MDLGEVRQGTVPEGGRVEEGAERVSTLVVTVRVLLATGIVRLEVERGLVDVARDLDIVGGLDAVDECESKQLTV